jgi:hypothetical protein
VTEKVTGPGFLFVLQTVHIATNNTYQHKPNNKFLSNASKILYQNMNTKKKHICSGHIKLQTGVSKYRLDEHQEYTEKEMWQKKLLEALVTHFLFVTAWTNNKQKAPKQR